MTGIATEYVRPYLYPKQEAALFSPKRWSLIEASTKSGKTVGSIAWILEQCFRGKNGQNFWWVAPVSDQAKIAFSRIKNGLTPGTFVASESPTPKIVFPLVGTVLWFKSADNPDSLYGEDVYAAVIDEASRCRNNAWYAVRSTLTATRGPCRIIGNVKGRKNWFYDMSRRCETGAEPNGIYTKITVYDAVEAGVIDIEEVEDAKRNLPEQVFRELYLAEAADDGGNPFGLSHIQQCTMSDMASGPAVCYGVDLAKKQDYFVIIGLNAEGKVCSFTRWNQVPWRDSIRRVWAICGEDVPVLTDSTGVGDPVLEELRVEHPNITGYNFSPTAKQKLVLGLAVAIQSHEIYYPESEISKELKLFEYVTTPSGNIAYSAPSGEHDDCVMALALARQQWAEITLGDNFVKYARDQVLAGLQQRNEARPKSRPGPDGQAYHSENSPHNELTAFYEETLRELQSQGRNMLCARCGEEIHRHHTKVEDGAAIWHLECIR